MGLRRSGQAEQIMATGGKFITAISRPAYRKPPECVGRSPEKKNPALSRRERKPKGRPGHASSGLNSRKLAMLQVIDPPRPLVAYGKALERALDAQAALVLVIVGLECGQAGRGEGRIWSEANRARLVQMHIHELGADIEALERGPDEVGADPRFLEVRDADRAAGAGRRIGGIVNLEIGAINRRTQDREPIMLVGAGDIPAPLLFAGAAAGENTVGIDLRVPAVAVIERGAAGAGRPVLIDRPIAVGKIIASDVAKSAFFISGLQP